MIGRLLQGKILIISAHADDIEIASYGLLQQLKNSGMKKENIEFIILGSDTTENLKVSENNLLEFTVKDNIHYGNLETLFMDKDKVKRFLLKYIETHGIADHVFFHSAIEKHNDHKVINEVVKEIFRPLSDNKLKSLIEFFVPLNSDMNFEYFNWCHLYHEIFEDKKYKKYDALKKYPKLKYINDRRGINFLEKFEELYAIYNGRNGYAEAYNILQLR